MKNSVDFHKIVDSDSNKLLAVLNINNMIPIPDEYVERLYYKELAKYRKFKNCKTMKIYEDLLRKELKEINSISDLLMKKAIKLRTLFIKNPNSRLSLRCCNFPLLEENISKYSKNRNK